MLNEGAVSFSAGLKQISAALISALFGASLQAAVGLIVALSLVFVLSHLAGRCLGAVLVAAGALLTYSAWNGLGMSAFFGRASLFF